MGIISACQISRRALPANVSVIGALAGEAVCCWVVMCVTHRHVAGMSTKHVRMADAGVLNLYWFAVRGGSLLFSLHVL